MILGTPLASVGRHNIVERICSRCLQNLPRSVVSRTGRRTISSTVPPGSSRTGGLSQQQLMTGYFMSNGFIGTTGIINDQDSPSFATVDSSSSRSLSPAGRLLTSTSYTLPGPGRRRRHNARRDAATITPDDRNAEPVIPPDASSTLTTLSSKLPAHSLRRTLAALLALSKPRLSFMIILTATTAYSLHPVPAVLSSTLTETPSLSALTLLFLTVGTGLASASANALNMLYEPQWDAMMSRTRNRPLVRGLVSGRAALAFAVVTGAAGVAALYFGVNPVVAMLGGLNIILYAGVYTPLKRVSVANTWAGAVVGAVPPLMGWTAAAGQYASGAGDWRELLLGEHSAGGWLMAGLLFAWQFPHFMALSWPIRAEYCTAGYRMLAWTDPARNARVALRYSLLFAPICVGLCAAGVTEWAFAALSAPVNAWLLHAAYGFWRHCGAHGSARRLFWASVWHLPVVMVLAMLAKKGMWQHVWLAVAGTPNLEDDDDDDDDGEDDGGEHCAVKGKSATMGGVGNLSTR